MKQTVDEPSLFYGNLPLLSVRQSPPRSENPYDWGGYHACTMYPVILGFMRSLQHRKKLNTQKLFVILDKLQKVTDASKRSRSHTYSTVTQKKKKKPGMNTMRKNYSTTNLRLTFVITLRARNNERMTFYIFFKIILFLAYI